MKCSKCGVELSDDTKFCSYCGHNVETTTSSPIMEEAEIPNILNNTTVEVESKKNDGPESLVDRIKDKIASKWSEVSTYSRVAIVSIAAFVLLCLVALFFGKIAAVVIAVVQITLAVVSILMHKGVIKLEQKLLWLKWLILAIALLFTVLNVMSYSWGTKESTSVQNLSSLEQSDEGQIAQIDWANVTLSNILPEPQSDMMDLLYNGEDWLSVTVHYISENDFLEYIRWCKEDYGFAVESDSFDGYFNAYNHEGYCLTLFYTETSKELSIDLEGPTSVTDNPVSTADSKIDYTDATSFEKAINDGVKVNGKIVQFVVNGYEPDSALGINCWAGEHLNFISEEELDVQSGNIIVGLITEEPSKVLGSWKIPYEVLSIDGKVDKNETTDSNTSEEPSDTQSTEITLTMDEDDFKGMDYQEAEKIFREMGFTKFEYQTVDTETESATDTICYIEITELFIGNSHFAKDDRFDADSTITFFYYNYVEPETPSPVYYSSNDRETAKKGDSGVFSYRAEMDSYDIYWIIDFDEGYVYYFTDGNDDPSCDKLKIDSGTLNDKVIIIYHDGGDTWSCKLHFKYVDHPETLIMVDQNGFDSEYSTTDLGDALTLRATKNIKDY